MLAQSLPACDAELRFALALVADSPDVCAVHEQLSPVSHRFNSSGTSSSSDAAAMPRRAGQDLFAGGSCHLLVRQKQPHRSHSHASSVAGATISPGWALRSIPTRRGVEGTTGELEARPAQGHGCELMER